MRLHVLYQLPTGDLVRESRLGDATRKRMAKVARWGRLCLANPQKTAAMFQGGPIRGYGRSWLVDKAEKMIRRMRRRWVVPPTEYFLVLASEEVAGEVAGVDGQSSTNAVK